MSRGEDWKSERKREGQTCRTVVVIVMEEEERKLSPSRGTKQAYITQDREETTRPAGDIIDPQPS